jgi:hypothetical protein
MPDENDRRRTFLIFVDRVVGDQATNGELVDVGGNACLFEPLPEAIDPA